MQQLITWKDNSCSSFPPTAVDTRLDKQLHFFVPSTFWVAAFVFVSAIVIVSPFLSEFVSIFVIIFAFLCLFVSQIVILILFVSVYVSEFVPVFVILFLFLFVIVCFFLIKCLTSSWTCLLPDPTMAWWPQHNSKQKKTIFSSLFVSKFVSVFVFSPIIVS